MMRCDCDGANLLLLAHGELGRFGRWRAERHVRRCARCQERHRNLVAASFAMADTIRMNDLPRWTPTRLAPAARVSATSVLMWFALSAAVAILLMMGSVIWQQVASGMLTGPAPMATPASATHTSQCQ